MTVINLFKDMVHKYKDRVAIMDNLNSYTYDHVDTLSTLLAQYIITKVGIGKPILLYLEPSIDQIVAIIAVLKARCHYIPFDTRSPLHRLDFILKDSNAEAIISNTTSQRNKDVQSLKKPIINMATLSSAANKAYSLPVTQTTDLAYIIYTSGSTGNPKGVKISHGNLTNLFQSTTDLFNFSCSDIWSYLHSYAFDFSVWEIWGALLHGACLNIFPYTMNISTEFLAEQLIQNKVTILNQTPSAFNRINNSILNAVKNGKSNLRYIIFGGEKLEPSNLTNWFQRHSNIDYPVLVNMYGITEITVHCTFSLIDEAYRKFGDKSIIGMPFSSLRYYFLPTDIPEYKELLLSGPSVFQEYLNRSDLTNEKFIYIDNTKYFRTGDIIRVHDTALEYIGRIDDQVKIRGYRIELNEINTNLKKYNDIQQSVTLPYTENNNQYLVSYITTKSNYYNSTIKLESQKQITNWQKIYQDLYKTNKKKDYKFNITGWKNSYTKKLFSTLEMSEWLDDTITKIKALKPKSILEIGCGSGMMLFNLLDTFESYIGVDFSSESIANLTDILSKIDKTNIYLFNSDAIDIDKIPNIRENKFDCVILNSVIQYFPTLDYLSILLSKISTILTDDAHIFIGDVRNFNLINEYHLSLIEHRQKNNPYAKGKDFKIIDKVWVSIAQEKELLVSPSYFKIKIPQLIKDKSTNIYIYGKNATISNELNLFRYDAIIKTTKSRLNIKQNIYYSKTDDIIELEAILGKHNFDKKPYLCIEHFEDSYLKELNSKFNMLASCNEMNLNTNVSLCSSRVIILSIAKKHCLKVLTTLHYNNNYQYDIIFYKSSLPLIETNQDMSIHEIIEYSNRPIDMDNKPLFEHLRTYLPTYMIPSYIHTVDEIPINKNGKDDKDALLSYHERKLQLSRYINYSYKTNDPQNSIQNILTTIWKNILKLRKVDLDDNFFELGGDSISSLQVVGKCKELNLNISIKNIFENPTIRQLSSLVKVASTKSNDALQPQTPFQLSPIQDWFFNYHQGDLNQYCQTFVLELQKNINIKRFISAIEMIFNARSTFSLRYNQNESKQWQQSYSVNNSNIKISYSGYLSNEDEKLAFVREAISSIDITNGPIAYGSIYISGGTYYCILTVHHLVIDTVSWSNIFSDLSAIYLDKANQSFFIFNQGAHYYEYIDKLNQIKKSTIIKDLNFWIKQQGKNYFNNHISQNRSNYKDTLQVNQIIPFEYHNFKSIDLLAVLLAALTLGLYNISKHDEIVISLEKHGRDDFVDIDLSRSIGWFTTIFPIKTMISNESKDPYDCLTHIKKLLLSIPNGGTTYPLAKKHNLLLENNTNYASDILFNFLGNLDHSINRSSVLKSANPFVKSFNKINLTNPYQLQVNSFLKGKKLYIYYIYDKNISGIVNMLQNDFEKIIKNLINYNNQTERYPLTGMQTYLSKFLDFGFQFHHLAFKINNRISTQVIKNSLLIIFNHFKIFNIAFENDGQNISNSKKKIIINEFFLKTINNDDIINCINTDAKNTFQQDSFLLRVNILNSMTTSEQVFIITYHQFILDGWSLQQFLDIWSSLIVNLESDINAEYKHLLPNDNYLDYLNEINSIPEKNTVMPSKKHNIETKSAMSILLEKYGMPNKKPKIDRCKIFKLLDIKQSNNIYIVCKRLKMTVNTFLMTSLGCLLHSMSKSSQIHFNIIDAGRYNDSFNKTMGVLTNIKRFVYENQNNHYDSLVYTSNQLKEFHTHYRSYDMQFGLEELVLSFQNFKKIGNIMKKFSNKKIVEFISVEKTNSPLTIRINPSKHIEFNFSYSSAHFTEMNIINLFDSWSKYLDQMIVDCSLNNELENTF